MQDMNEDDLQTLILTSREMNSGNAGLKFFNFIIITSMKMKSSILSALSHVGTYDAIQEAYYYNEDTKLKQGEIVNMHCDTR